ncbi:MAG TPA: IS200/IS605 family transposase [Phototrophicaceae bacterium]|nr:IS200/IS605 family transposase [Phototrophicaceae bacterium]
MPAYRKGAHTLYDIQSHLVWVTKYRYQVLRGEVAERTREILRQVCMSRDLAILQGHVSADHIHRLVSCPPLLSPAKIVQSLKGVSSRKLQGEVPHLKKRYWGQHLWARGYFCATVDTVTQDLIKDYIEKHQSEPPDENFGIEP